jgi:hypothetical protein
MAQTDPALGPVVVGRFRVIDRLGKGGMAEVFLGVPQQPLPGDPPFVALKRLLPSVAAEQPETAKMLMDEAAILSRLQHRNIVRLIDVVTAGGSTYLVMELLDGVDLSTIFKKFATAGLRIPWAFSASVVADVAEALAYAAEVVTLDGRALGLVHRDISPHNIFLHADGSVRLLDFGVARAADRMTQTRTGHLKGKLAYMSPEQAAGDPLDHRSDIFALGIVLYEFTVGRRPFRGKNEFSILQSVISGKIAWPSEMYGNFPSELERILQKMLARPLDERYAHARDVAVDLRAWLATLGNVTAQLPPALMARHFPEKIELARQHAVAVTAVVDDGHGNDPALGFALDVSGGVDVSRSGPQPVGPPPPLEKHFDDDTTVLIVHRYVAAGAWRRALDGLEGDVVLRLDSDEDAGPHAAPLLSAIAALVDDINVRIEKAPRAVVEEHRRQEQNLTHVTIGSSCVSCPHCGAAQVTDAGFVHVLTEPADGATDATSQTCTACSRAFAVDSDDPAHWAAPPTTPAGEGAAPGEVTINHTAVLPGLTSPVAVLAPPTMTPPKVAPPKIAPPTMTTSPVPSRGLPMAAWMALTLAFLVVAVGAFLLGRGSGG